jgi:hypothetical protein
MSHDVVFDESTSWYLPSVPEPDSNPSSDGEVSEAEVPPDEPEIGTRPESPISVPLTGPSAGLGRFDQSDDEPASSGDSAMYSPRKQPKRRFTCKENGKRKVSDADTQRRSHADARLTRRHKVPRLRERSPYQVTRGYADLPARRNPSNSSGITSTWRIIMRT